MHCILACKKLFGLSQGYMSQVISWGTYHPDVWELWELYQKQSGRLFCVKIVGMRKARLYLTNVEALWMGLTSPDTIHLRVLVTSPNLREQGSCLGEVLACV